MEGKQKENCVIYEGRNRGGWSKYGRREEGKEGEKRRENKCHEKEENQRDDMMRNQNWKGKENVINGEKREIKKKNGNEEGRERKVKMNNGIRR